MTTTGPRAHSLPWFVYAVNGLVVITQLLALARLAVWIPLHDLGLCAFIASALGMVTLALATTLPADPSPTLASPLAPATSGSAGALPKEG